MFEVSTLLCILTFKKSSLGLLFSVSVQHLQMQIQISPPHVVVNSRSKETQGK